MNKTKEVQYRKSIRFELIRAKLAFDDFFVIAGYFITNKFDDNYVHGKIKIFDAYSRWLGHLYESLLALVIIETQNSVSENSNYTVTDPAIQFEAQRALNRWNALISSGKIDQKGRVQLQLEPNFAEELRQLRNKCAFHCSSNRIQSELLQDFMNKHHHMAYRLYCDLLGFHGRIDSEYEQDLGAINQFFSVGRRVLANN